MANFTGLQYTPVTATEPIDYNGNISSYLGKNFGYGQLASLDQSLGQPAGSQSTFTQNGNVYGVKDAGNNTFTLNQVGSVAQDQANANNQNFGNLVNASNNAITDFLSGYNSDTQDAISKANTQFNIPNQTNLVNSLNSRIADLSSNFSNSGGGAAAGTGLGGYNNEAQVGENLNSRELPQLETATSNLNTSIGAAQQQEQIALQPDQAYGQLLSTNIQTAMQGLTATQQTEMEGIIAKINAGVSLTNTEVNAGEAYAQQILTNANNVTLQQMKNQYTSIPQNNAIINPATGQAINPYLLATEAGGIYNP